VSITYLEDPSKPDLRPASSLSLELSGAGPDVVITIRGELERDTDHLLTEVVDDVVRHHPGPVVLDMSGVTFICAHGVGALLRAHDMITAAGGRLTLRDPSPLTRGILAITGDDRLLALDPAGPPIRSIHPFAAPPETAGRPPQDRRTTVSALRLEADRSAARKARKEAIAIAAAARRTRIRAQQMLQDNDERRARLHSRNTSRSACHAEQPVSDPGNPRRRGGR
jgi:anti-anti-sigma factor